VSASPAAPGPSPAATGPSPAATGPSSGAELARNLTRSTVLADQVETASGLWGKFWGLMGRPSLPAGAALWLPGSNGIHMMFMRFPIDAVFVGKPDPADGARPVLSVHAALPVWRGLVPLVRGAQGVLELPVGTIAASGTAVGDRLLIGG
jgi:uncharacterized membrane protein (UPF0127 family)